jgi:hypothetical protein
MGRVGRAIARRILPMIERDPLRKILAVCALLLFAWWLTSILGCALEPQSFGPFIQHDSHIGQHFGVNQTDYGANLLGINARWQRGAWYVDVSEAVNVQGARPGGYGELDGPRECFEARIGYAWGISQR